MGRFVVAIIVLLGCASLFAQAPRVLIVPVEVQDSKVLPTQIQTETQQKIGAAIEAVMAAELAKAGVQMVKALESDKLAKAVKAGLKADAFELMAGLAKEAVVDYVVAVVLVRWTQANKSTSDVLASPGSPASETTAEFRLWIYDAKSTSLSSDGSRKVLRGVAGGSHIGTQNQKELSGSPEDKGRFIDLINRQRASYVGRAVWLGSIKEIGVAMGLKLEVRR